MMNEQDVNTYLNFLSDTAFEILYVLEENEWQNTGDSLRQGKFL